MLGQEAVGLSGLVGLSRLKEAVKLAGQGFQVRPHREVSEPPLSVGSHPFRRRTNVWHGG